MDERLVDQAAEQSDRLLALERILGADVLGRLQAEAPGEHREAPQEDLLVGLEQVEAPGERRPQRLLPGHRRAAPAREQVERVVEALDDLCGGEDADPGRRELDRQRHPVEAVAEGRDRDRVLVVQLEAGGGLARANREEPHRLRLQRSSDGERSPSFGRESEGTRQVTSPGTRSGSRLVASTVRRGQWPSSASTRCATGSIRCSQLSSSSSCWRSPMCPASATSGARSEASRVSRAWATAGPISSGSPSAASSTGQTPSEKSPSRCPASSRASLVLPQPPAPVSVNSRELRRSAAASASSRSRPMKLVSCRGRAGPWLLAPSARGARLQPGQLGLQAKAKLVEGVAPLPAPVLVAIGRQQLGVEALERRPVGAGLAPLARRGSQLFKRDRVDLDRVLRTEQDQFFAQLQVAAALEADRVQRAPGREDRLVQVVAGGVRVPPRPQQLGGLLGVQASLRRQRQQLDQRLRLAQPPGVVGDCVAPPDADGEHPEEADAQHLIAHRCAFRTGTRHRIRKPLRSAAGVLITRMLRPRT